MITHNDGSIEIEAEDIHIPESEVDNIIRNFFHSRDINAIEAKIEDLRKTLLSLENDNNRLQKRFNEIYDEKWKDNELLEMKQKMERAIRERSYGFPLTEEERNFSYDWQRKHDSEVHSNPEGYHGASGGGFSYTFYPTGLGTTCNCFCNQCKAKAIREAGAKWYDRCKELGGVCEVVGWEAF